MSKEHMNDDLGTDELLSDIYRKIKAKTKHEECLYCQNVNWFSMHTGRNAGSLRLMNGRVFHAYTLACTNCGFVRQHIADIVDGSIQGPVEFLKSE